MTAFDRTRVRLGMEVVGADGDRVGTVKDLRDTDFLVDRAMQRDVYVPFDAIRSIDGDVITLTVAAGAVDQQGWPSPPLTQPTA